MGLLGMSVLFLSGVKVFTRATCSSYTCHSLNWYFSDLRNELSIHKPSDSILLLLSFSLLLHLFSMLCLTAEAKEKYISRYLGGSIGRLTWPAAASSRPNLSDQTNPDCGPLSPTLTARLPPLDVTPDEAVLIGYMPHRDDFERVCLCVHIIYR
jgi:hypothetical protein